MKNIISIDFGKKGAYALFSDSKFVESFFIPIKKTLVSPKKKKIVGQYKNGKPKYKTIKNAKYKYDIDWLEFKTHMLSLISMYNIETVVIESQNGMAGNSARSSSTISKNYGRAYDFLQTLKNTKDLFQIENYINNVVEVNPQKWKRDLNIIGIKDKKERKEKAINLAKELGYEPTRDDDAEAFLIGYWFINYADSTVGS